MKAIENLKSYFKSVNDRRFLEKFEDKQHFYRVGYDERVRWFEMVGPKERREALKKGYIDGGTCQRLFPKYANLVAPHMALTDEQFAFILKEGYMEALEGYVESRSTLSVSKVYALIKATILRAGAKAQTPISEDAKRLPGLLYRYIVREGLPVALVSFVEDYPADEIGSLREIIKRGAEVHYHVNAVKTGLEDHERVAAKFETYLSWLKKENIEMPDEAAVLMKGRQVLAFHKAGLHLSKKAIVSLLANDECGVTTNSILSKEVMYPIWPELKYVLEAKPDTYCLYQGHYLNGSIKKESNS